MTDRKEYPVRIAFETTVRAKDETEADQAARKRGMAMADDSANKHYEYMGVTVGEPNDGD